MVSGTQSIASLSRQESHQKYREPPVKTSTMKAPAPVAAILFLLASARMSLAVVPNYSQESSVEHNYSREQPRSSSRAAVSAEENRSYAPAPAHVFPADTKQRRWAAAASAWLQRQDCSTAVFTTRKECLAVQELEQSRMNIYLADPSPRGRLEAVLPDDDLRGEEPHDAVLVVDPHPGADFGHLVIVFYLDLDGGGVEPDRCQEQGGTRLDGGECLTPALKRRCKNVLERRSRRRNFARRCEINFVPLVRLVGDVSNEQLLTCRDNMPGWAACPELRPSNATARLICNPLRDNNKRCETTHAHVHTSCRVMEICDQAVLVAGGWNRWTHGARHRDNVRRVYHMVRRHGYLDRNVKVFFANGDAEGIEKEGGGQHAVYPAALKPALRSHLQKLCSVPHCADTLLLYLNSPARTDGTSLLWDIDQDGYASDDELYRLDELLGDIANCAARQVQVVADQSYAGELARAVRRSKNHRNVAVFAGSKDNEHTVGAEFTETWTSTDHTYKCAKHVFKDAKKSMRHSTPDLQEGADVADVTIFGAPCDVMPPFTQRELEQNYLGCQNLPSALWVMKILNAQQKMSLSSQEENAEMEDTSY